MLLLVKKKYLGLRTKKGNVYSANDKVLWILENICKKNCSMSNISKLCELPNQTFIYEIGRLPGIHRIEQPQKV